MAQNTPRFSRSSASNATPSARSRTKGSTVTNARANAQRTKLEAQQEAREQQRVPPRPSSPHKAARSTASSTRQGASISGAIETYLQDHIGGNHSPKTLEWHRTALGLFTTFLAQEEALRYVRDIDASQITAWFASLRTTPGARGKLRSERTIQTYARSARAFSTGWFVASSSKRTPLTWFSSRRSANL